MDLLEVARKRSLFIRKIVTSGLICAGGLGLPIISWWYIPKALYTDWHLLKRWMSCDYYLVVGIPRMPQLCALPSDALPFVRV